MREDQAVDEIIDRALARLDTARAGLLDGITTVVSGERMRTRPQAPYLWVVAPGSRHEHTHSARRTVVLDLRVVASVFTELPEAGWREAKRYALRAQEVLLAGRRLDLDWIVDVRTPDGQTDMAVGPRKDGRLFDHWAALEVRFTISQQ